MSKSIVSLRHVDKWYGKNHVVKDMNLEIEEGEFLTLLGPSGCGKTTTLRMIAGFEDASSGTIEVQGERVEEKEPYQRDVNTVFQNYSLFPHMTVFENVAYGPTIRGIRKAEIQSKVSEMLALVQMSGYEKRKPEALSGGQKQRVAIARALATNPKILLCDEATSALDPKTTRAILALLKEINEKYGITIVIITHEMAVVQEICSHVAIIDEGVLAETGSVTEVFQRPKSKAAKKLVFQGEGEQHLEMKGKRCIRIVFTSNSSFEPVIANMVLACKMPVNILLADTRDIGGVAHGQMVLQLPEDQKTAESMIEYLKTRKLEVEELDNYVG